MLVALAVLGHAVDAGAVEDADAHRVDGGGEVVEQAGERQHLVLGDAADVLPLAVVADLVHPVRHAQVVEHVGGRRRAQHEREHAGEAAVERGGEEPGHDVGAGDDVGRVAGGQAGMMSHVPEDRSRRRWTSRRWSRWASSRCLSVPPEAAAQALGVGHDGVDEGDPAGQRHQVGRHVEQHRVELRGGCGSRPPASRGR